MRVVRAGEIERTLPGDVEVVGIGWLNDDHDLELRLRLPAGAGSRHPARLVATWATDLRIELDLSGRFGVIPAWEVTINGLDRGRWSVAIDFGHPLGAISFECNDLQLEIPE
jgi:hypothetical protein